MNVNKFELVGITVSVGLMVVALFLMRLENAPSVLLGMAGDNQSAAALVATQEEGGLTSAITDAKSNNGKISKLIIDDVVIGSGVEVEEGDIVTVHYIGSLQNGQQFDNSKNKGESFVFTVGKGKVIEGWDIGILGMKVGGQRVLVIPSDMAYGKEGYGPIPSGATLVYVIELLSIE